MEIVYLLFKQVMMVIRFFIWIKKVLLLLFQDCLNVTIMDNLSNFVVWNLSCRIIYCRFLPFYSFILFLERHCLIHVVKTLKSHHGLLKTLIYVLEIMFHFSISPPYSCRLMVVRTILNSDFTMKIRSGAFTPLRNKYSALLPSCIIRFISTPSKTIRSGLWPLTSSSRHIK